VIISFQELVGGGGSRNGNRLYISKETEQENNKAEEMSNQN
jgi:hypothetical protein